jgi:GTPase
MLPVLAIVGRPNVGKSTLFNQMTKSRNALVADMPGLTRDRQYGEAVYNDRRFILVDTGGIGEGEGEAGPLNDLMQDQSWLAVLEADVVLFLVDARAGINAADEQIASRLRRENKKTLLVANKIDGIDADVAVSDFYSLALGEPHPIAASHNRGVTALLERTVDYFPKEAVADDQTDDQVIRLTIVGKPNVGKSTLVNRMLGENRVVASDQPGTTRDSIEIPFKHRDQDYMLIDTAGVRRRSRVSNAVEKFSIIKTLQAIESTHVVIFVIDAQDGVSEQDLKLLGFVINAGKALVIAVNKWDGMEDESREFIKKSLERRLVFADFARTQFISALHGTGVGGLYQFVIEAYRSAMRQITTSQATQLLEKALAEHQPPLVRGRRVKIRYAHLGGKNPPILVLHGNQLSGLPGSYKKYLINYYRKRLHLVGTPIHLRLKAHDNPYAK